MIVVGCSLSAVAQEPHGARPKFDAFEVATVKPVGADAKLRAVLPYGWDAPVGGDQFYATGADSAGV